MTKPGEPLEPTALSPIGDAVTLPSPPPAPDLPPGTSVGRYVIEGRIGAGGMGVVFLADDPQLGRRVALKLLRPEVTGEGSSTGRNRLVREAHALAKLNHPNVVTIYDSGIYGDQVFLAMELVEGSDLSIWLQAPRDWREILAVFVKAGHGLAAAHAAGLVHRDFKPANVLIGNDGAVKVTDFGLARAAGSDDPATVATPGRTTRAPLLDAVTQAGVVSGTIAYMSPEQLLGRPADSRADEFSFCVALYEALYQERPYRAAPEPSTLREPPKGTAVPVWVRRALLRGLSIEPADRYPTLDALLAALADDPTARRRQVVAWAGIVALVVAAIGATAAIVIQQRAAADPCHDPGAKLASVWDDTVRARVQAAFAASGAPGAVGTAAYAEKAMDRASAAWLAAYRDACQATRARHAQSEGALNLRLDCLDDQRFDLRASSELLSHPDGKDLSAAIGAACTLPVPSECADARALSVVEQPAAERRSQIEALRLRLAQGQALDGAGRYAAAIEALEPLPDEAQALEAHPLEAQTLLALAHAHERRRGPSDVKAAAKLDARAASLAEAAHIDSLATQAAGAVAWEKAYLGSPATEVDAALDRTRDDLRRAGVGGVAEYAAEEDMAVVALVRGHNVEGALHARRGLALAQKIFGSDRQEPLVAATVLASCLEPLGQYDELGRLLRGAVAGSDSILGPKSAWALAPELDLAENSFDMGRLDEAQQTLDRLFARMETATNPGYLGIATAVQACVQAASGLREESRRTAHRAVELMASLQLLEGFPSLEFHRYEAEAWLRAGDPGSALTEYLTFLARGDSSSHGVGTLRLGGWAYLDAGQPEKALPLLERALALSAAHPYCPGWVARLRFQLARALVETHGDRSRAEALAQAAHDELQNEAVAKDLLAEVDGWREQVFKPR